MQHLGGGLAPPCRIKDENQQQTQPTYDIRTGNRTRATLVEGECSTTAPSLLPYSRRKVVV